MKDTKTWTIIQYNVNRSKDRVQHDFLHKLDPQTHHIVAIQEPWRNPADNSTIRHPAYHLVSPETPRSRTCIYISKEIAIDKWKIDEVPEEAGGDITSISLQTDQGKVRVHNIYNPPPLSHCSQKRNTLEWIPQILSQDGHHLIVGDFNLHHPLWGGQGVLSHHKVAEDLIEILTQKNMELILPEGTITWQRRGSHSTLDLAFISHRLLGTVMRCQRSEELESASDHIPISTELLIEPPREEKREPRPQWKKADWEKVNQRIESKLSEQPHTIQHLSTPEAIDQRIAQVTQAIQESVEELIPKADPSRFSKPYWTTKCTLAVKTARKARRRWTEQGSVESWVAYCRANNSKKSLIKKEKQMGWRAVVTEVTNDPQKIWKLAKWARKDQEEYHKTPQIPDIIDNDGKTHTLVRDKAIAMARHFFPPPRPADTRDIDGYVYDNETEDTRQNITESEIEDTLSKLVEGKAPGPDEIPGILLKQCKTSLTKELTSIFNACIHIGYHPKKFKESTTVVIRKPQKPCYNVPKSYRPIALLNTMGKLLEKIIANRITKAIEKYNLLPDEQMGARPGRSTITAVELLTKQIHTIWGRDKKKVASLLSLDISGAFDYISHPRLIHIMRVKGIPKQITEFVKSFLTDRTTEIKLGNYTSEQIQTNTGIPQGSPLSPILFLIFASTLLPLLRTPNSASVGFVDDTNILTWSDTTEENCRTLENIHKTCEEWAAKNGVKFAPEKYQLMHFSRTTKRHNLQASLQIQGHNTSPSTSIRILGIHLDPKLHWGAHIKKTEQKAETQMRSITSLTHSTWGATFHKARMLYSAIVRPSITYGSQIWAQEGQKGKIPERVVQPLRKIQNRCLRTITGAYKSTSQKALEHETATLPMEIYLKYRRVQHAGLSLNQPVRKIIEEACNKIEQKSDSYKEPLTLLRNKDLEIWERACKEEESKDGQKRALKVAAYQEWANSWPSQTRNLHNRHRSAADPEIWKAANIFTDRTTGKKKLTFRHTPSELHRNLTRAQSSIAMQIRSEHIGFNSYLYRRKIPGVATPSCPCGYPSQNVKHMVMVCPRWSKGRGEVLRKTKTRSFEEMANNQEDIARITQWIQKEGWLEQFRLSGEVDAVIEARKKRR